jgi:hypothetical protein
MLKTIFKCCFLRSTALDGAARAEDNAKQAYDQAVPQEKSLKQMSVVDKAPRDGRDPPVTAALWPMHQSKGLGLRARCVRSGLLLWRRRAPCVWPRRIHPSDARCRNIRSGRRCPAYTRTRDRDLVADHGSRHRGGRLHVLFSYRASFPTIGKEAYGIVPGETLYTPTYYYQTYAKVDGKWKIKTSDHNSFDLKRDFKPYTVIMPNAYAAPDGTAPYKR